MKSNQKDFKLDAVKALNIGASLFNSPGGVDKMEAITACVLSRDPELMLTMADLVGLESSEYVLSLNPFHTPFAQSYSDHDSNAGTGNRENAHNQKNRTGPAQENPVIFIGTIILNNTYGRYLNIPVKSLAQHNIIVGTTGSGKSWLVRHIAPQLQQKGISVIIFDCEGEYAPLLKSCKPGSVLILSPYTDKDNFLEPPPGVSPRQWLNKLRDILREVFFLRDGAINLLMEILNKLYKERGVFNGSDNWPSIVDLVKALEKLSFRAGSRYSGYLESLVNRFTGLLVNLEPVLCCKKGYDLTKEKEVKIIIYDTSGLSQYDANFYVCLKILREATYREKLPPQGMKVAIVIEETHSILNNSVSSRYDLGEPFALRAVRQHRKKGICYFFCDQSPAELPTTLSANVSNNFVLKTVNDKNIKWVKQCIGLLPDQCEYLKVMPTRQVLFQSGDDFPVPVLVEIPELNFDHVAPDEIENHMTPLLENLKYTPLDEDETTEINTGMDMPGGVGKKKEEQPGQFWKQILEKVTEKKAATPDEVFKEFSDFTYWERKKLLVAMEKQGMIEICKVSSGFRGNRKNHLTLTDKGAAFIGVDYDAAKLKGKGSLEHRALQYLISESMKQDGKTVEIEHHVNGKSVDIAEIRQDGRSIAYEIELQPSHSHVIENVKRDLEAGFCKVIVIIQNLLAKEKAQKLVVENVDFEKLSKVEFKLVKEFFPKTKEKAK